MWHNSFHVCNTSRCFLIFWAVSLRLVRWPHTYITLAWNSSSPFRQNTNSRESLFAIMIFAPDVSHSYIIFLLHVRASPLVGKIITYQVGKRTYGYCCFFTHDRICSDSKLPKEEVKNQAFCFLAKIAVAKKSNALCKGRNSLVSVGLAVGTRPHLDLS